MNRDFLVPSDQCTIFLEESQWWQTLYRPREKGNAFKKKYCIAGKLSTVKTFAKMANMTISWRKLQRIHTIDSIWVACACNVREENFHKCAQIHKSFLAQKVPAIQYNLRLELLLGLNQTLPSHTCTRTCT